MAPCAAGGAAALVGAPEKLNRTPAKIIGRGRCRLIVGLIVVMDLGVIRSVVLFIRLNVLKG